MVIASGAVQKFEKSLNSVVQTRISHGRPSWDVSHTAKLSMAAKC